MILVAKYFVSFSFIREDMPLLSTIKVTQKVHLIPAPRSSLYTGAGLHIKSAHGFPCSNELQTKKKKKAN